MSIMRKLKKAIYWLISLACVLLIIAGVFFHFEGTIALILLAVASVVMLFSLIVAFTSSSSMFTYSFRFGVFWGIWAAIFFNQGEKTASDICCFLCFVCFVCIVGYIIYYLSIYSNRNIDDMLDN